MSFKQKTPTSKNTLQFEPNVFVIIFWLTVKHTLSPTGTSAESPADLVLFKIRLFCFWVADSDAAVKHMAANKTAISSSESQTTWTFFLWRVKDVSFLNKSSANSPRASFSASCVALVHHQSGHKSINCNLVSPPVHTFVFICQKLVKMKWCRILFPTQTLRYTLKVQKVVCRFSGF